MLSSPEDLRDSAVGPREAPGGQGAGGAPPRDAAAPAEPTPASRQAELPVPAEPWMETAFALVSLRAKDPPAASRAYACWRSPCTTRWWPPRTGRRSTAARRPQTEGTRLPAPPSTPHRRDRVALLAYLFPERPRAQFEQMAAAAASRVASSGSTRGELEAGLRLGRAVAAEVITRAKTDGSRRRWKGKPPRGLATGAPRRARSPAPCHRWRGRGAPGCFDRAVSFARHRLRLPVRAISRRGRGGHARKPPA